MNQQHLVTADWLKAHLHDSNLVILDATLPKAGQQADTLADRYIPGTRYFDIKKAFSDQGSSLPNTRPSSEQFAAEAQKLGVNQESQIVVYDQHGLYSAGRAWWLFKAMGHQNVAILDGGLPAWEKMGGEVRSLQHYQGPLGNFTAEEQTGYFCDAEEVLQEIGSETTTILDARGTARFTGAIAEPREGMRSGHIPSSENIPYTSLQTAEGTLLGEEELRGIFKNKIKGDRLIFSCGSGVTACILALGASILGYDQLTVYDGSWSEWGSRKELPVSSE
ncbi:sulfurtransferase [Algivirga pacifica]|uniref:3-mercaptopyruvate sulfurtransferase n=1 Tax=Algivirga pacifica TaxID=1162670 RepID=A0ABP9DAD9_9BACT